MWKRDSPDLVRRSAEFWLNFVTIAPSMGLSTWANKTCIGLKGSFFMWFTCVVLISTNVINRLWWIISIGLSIWGCVYMLFVIWLERKDKYWIDTDFDMLPTSTIPFPTVTICFKMKTTKDKFDYVSKIKTINSLGLTQTE